MRKVEFINKDWLYKNAFKEEFINLGFDYNEFENIELPHTNIMIPYNYFDEKMYQFISCYVKKINIPSDLKGKRLFLDFEGVMIFAKVYCNGRLICEHKGGYTFFEAEITNVVNYGEENIIVVEVDSTERADIPPHGNVVDYLTYGGIYREVSLRVVEFTYIKKIFAKTNRCLYNDKILEVDIELESNEEKNVKLDLSLYEEDRKIKSIDKKYKVNKGTSMVGLKMEDLNNIELWDIDNPKLYNIEVTIYEKNQVLDLVKEKIGFRQAIFKNDGFYLNNKKLKIIGLNRHQAYPYVGYAMPKRIQEKDADILKYEMAINLVRCSHYPQSKHFLNRCDEIGLLVFEEIPGWQHIGDEEWKNVSLKNVKDMITRDFNHPSIILWGVRINESRDDHEFYTKTNELSHRLDSTRQTGGVRYIQKSELLEDVYTFNDFVHSGGNEVLRKREEVTGLNYEVPLLVTENNGHMYPTKNFDHEAKLVEHTNRHLRVINEALGREDITGNISWCAFDYNTHSCFGSGDKICYHGVSDMFRIPKYAAYAYGSQKDINNGIVLEVISVASRGERDGGGIIPINVLTNCDYIKVYKNGLYVDDFYPQTDLYKFLKHAPIIISHLLPQETDWGFSEKDEKELKAFIVDKITTGKLVDMAQEDINYLYNIATKYNKTIYELMAVVIKVAGGWGDQSNILTIEGYVNDKCIIIKEVGEIKSMSKLSLEADDKVLYANGDTYDATRIVIKIIDTLGNVTPFINEAVDVKVEGPAQVMGPKKFALQGGSSAFWIRTLGKKGKVRVEVTSEYFKKEIFIDIK